MGQGQPAISRRRQAIRGCSNGLATTPRADVPQPVAAIHAEITAHEAIANPGPQLLQSRQRLGPIQATASSNRTGTAAFPAALRHRGQVTDAWSEQGC